MGCCRKEHRRLENMILEMSGASMVSADDISHEVWGRFVESWGL
jgi:hypothetical protein